MPYRKLEVLCPLLLKCEYTYTEVTQSCLTLCDPMNCTRLLCPLDFPGNGTDVGCYFLLQGIFPTQGSNPGLLQCRLNHLSHQGSPWLSDASFPERPGKPRETTYIWLLAKGVRTILETMSLYESKNTEIKMFKSSKIKQLP